jgi:hypothetical protein
LGDDYYFSNHDGKDSVVFIEPTRRRRLDDQDDDDDDDVEVDDTKEQRFNRISSTHDWKSPSRQQRSVGMTKLSDLSPVNTEPESDFDLDDIDEDDDDDDDDESRIRYNFSTRPSATGSRVSEF